MTTTTGSVQICWERHAHFTATISTARMRQVIAAEPWDDDDEREALAVLDRIDAREPVTAAQVSTTLGRYCGAELFGDLEDEETTEGDTKALELCQVALPEATTATA